MFKLAKTLVLSALVPLTGCVASVGPAGMEIPESAPQECGQQCAQVGMELGAIVTMAGTVGCVCSPTGAGDEESASASAAGGMAAVLMQRRQAQQQQQNSASGYATTY